MTTMRPWMPELIMFDDYSSYDYQQDEVDDLRAQVRFERRRRNKLMRQPDPRDPDYPFDDDEDACDTEDNEDYNG